MMRSPTQIEDTENLESRCLGGEYIITIGDLLEDVQVMFEAYEADTLERVRQGLFRKYRYHLRTELIRRGVHRNGEEAAKPDFGKVRSN